MKNKKNLWLLVWPAGIILYAAARFCPFLAEYVFARGIYRVYGSLMSFITGLFPFSLAEWLLIAVPAGFVVWIVVSVIKIFTKKEARADRALNLVRGILVFPGIIFLWFVIGCGTNYYRYEFSRFSGLEIKKSTVEELVGLCRELAAECNKARKEAVEYTAVNDRKKSMTGTEEGTANGTQEQGREEGLQETGQIDDENDRIDEKSSNRVYDSPYTDRERGKLARAAMKKLGEKYPVLKGYYPYYKPVFFSKVMSRFEITGVYFPWTVEANVDVDVPDYTIGATACHELSHLRGFMREDEANFIGYLACEGSDTPELRYSGYMLALTYAMNSLYAESKELHREVWAELSEGVVTDIRAHSQYWKQFENTVYSEAGEKMNDTYLKANNQADGTKSYGRMVDLLLAKRRNGE